MLDFMMEHDSTCIPTMDNLKNEITKIALKEFIQKSSFIVACWHKLLQHMEISYEEFLELYSRLIPTPTEALKMLKFMESANAYQNKIATLIKTLI